MKIKKRKRTLQNNLTDLEYTQMNNTYEQPMLFPNMNPIDGRQKYQIKNYEDPTFGVTLNVNEDQDPETLALESLGYFVVSEYHVD
jgi:hypothetical protein